MTAIEIVKKYLIENGYEGLVSENGQSGCEVNDLAPCGECGFNTDCEAGYKVPCDSDCPAVGGCEYHIATEKPEQSK